MLTIHESCQESWTLHASRRNAHTPTWSLTGTPTVSGRGSGWGFASGLAPRPRGPEGSACRPTARASGGFPPWSTPELRRQGSRPGPWSSGLPRSEAPRPPAPRRAPRLVRSGVGPAHSLDASDAEGSAGGRRRRNTGLDRDSLTRRRYLGRARPPPGRARVTAAEFPQGPGGGARPVCSRALPDARVRSRPEGSPSTRPSRGSGGGD